MILVALGALLGVQTGYEDGGLTGITVTVTGTVSVVRYGDEIAGQFVTLGAQDVTVYTVVEYTVDVVKLQ